MTHPMTALQRVLTTLGHREPDRVPFFLLATLHPARELGLSIKEYFARTEHVVEGQRRLRARYGHDCLYGLFYAALELEAWGGETIFFDDGPPNAGAPVFRFDGDFERLSPPRVGESKCLIKVLEALIGLRALAGNEVPVIGVVVSPFSLPVMQLGFDRYIELLHEQPARIDQLLRVNEDFCVEWANAQLAAGATALAYFDPVSSPTIVPHDLYGRFGFPSAQRTIARINGPTITHLGSGRGLPIVDLVAQTGTLGLGVSALEDLGALKAACRGHLALLGNLNGVEMRRWTAAQAEEAVKAAIAHAGPGGGFILADNHGEIPWQVPDNVLQAIAAALQRWGRYPLHWVEADGG